MVALVAALTLAVIPPGFHQAVKLQPAASYVATHPARDYCANTWADWRAYAESLGQPDNVDAITPATGGDMSLFAPPICDSLIARLNGKPVSGFYLADAILTLTHESIHERGIKDEGTTECDAIHEMPRVAVRFFHVKPGKPLRALMAQAWKAHRMTPTTYQAVC